MEQKTIQKVYNELAQTAQVYKARGQKMKDPVEANLYKELGRELYFWMAQMEQTEEINPTK